MFRWDEARNDRNVEKHGFAAARLPFEGLVTRCPTPAVPMARPVSTPSAPARAVPAVRNCV
jgi:hypothetical protein